jgi:DUF4097 and DUF4098 domain-containing protein YvlB
MLTAHTSFSSITCRDIAAPVDLKTSYGSIKCTNLTSREIEVSSSFGSIDIECSDQTGPEPHADIETSYGSIKFETPRGYSGRVKAKTSFGEIETNLPITVSGKINKDKISGNIGSGSGSLDLRTSFGSIAIK